MSQSPISEDITTPAPEHSKEWLLIERIVSSPQFRKTARLKELLHYLVEMSLRGDTSKLTEQRIGQAVFGKSSDYSPVEDSSVRVHIRQLRLKLHEYFDSEGREEALIVEIPKGGYALAFRPVRILPVELPLGEATVAQRPRTIRAVLPWVLVAALSVFSLVLLWQRNRGLIPLPSPWPLSAVFANGHRTEIVLADCTYGVRRIISGKPVSLESYMRRDFQQKTSWGQTANGTEAYMARYTADALLTSWADVAIASTFQRILPGTLDHVTVRSARDLHPRDLDDGDYIFVGSPASNPWVLLFQNRLNFIEVRPDEVGGFTKFFLNKKPQPGEQAKYQGLARTGVDGNDFATLALLPSESGRGNILLIQGLHQEATEAAGMLLTDESGRKRLKKALGLQGDPTAAVYFEVLLRIEAVGGSPKSATIVATRLIKY